MNLTDIQIRQAKGKEKVYRLSDGGGLAVRVQPKGSKLWQFRYRDKRTKKEQTFSIGSYPSVGLKEARAERDRLKRLLSQGIDPNQQKRVDQLRGYEESLNTFEVVAKQWLETKVGEWSDDTVKRVGRSLEANIFPSLGEVPVTQITTLMLKKELEVVESRGSLHMSKRISQRCSSIFKYAIALGLCSHNPADYLQSVLKKPKNKHFPAFHHSELPQFLNKLDTSGAKLQNALAIKLIMLTFVRSSEMVGARWEEVDLENKVWIIPAERMKQKNKGDHIVPLARESIILFEQLASISSNREFVFPNRNDPKRPMTREALSKLMNRLGYQDKMTVHGFRSVASSALNESGKFNPDAIERQLHHGEKNATRAAYNRAEYLEERAEMMQWWASFVAECRNNNSVLHYKFA